jgi:hypothetical protein
MMLLYLALGKILQLHVDEVAFLLHQGVPLPQKHILSFE